MTAQQIVDHMLEGLEDSPDEHDYSSYHVLSVDVKARVEALRQEAQQLPADADDADLWAARNYKDSILMFFNALSDYLEEDISPEFMRRVQSSDLSGSCTEVWKRLNDPAHPVRNGMICLGAGLPVRDDNRDEPARFKEKDTCYKVSYSYRNALSGSISCQDRFTTLPDAVQFAKTRGGRVERYVPVISKSGLTRGLRSTALRVPGAVRYELCGKYDRYATSIADKRTFAFASENLVDVFKQLKDPSVVAGTIYAVFPENV